jgi:hypothetical protein
MNLVPEVVTNPVAEGGEDMVVLEVVVFLLVLIGMVLVLELETVLVPTPGRRHWKKKSLRIVHTKPVAQTAVAISVDAFQMHMWRTCVSHVPRRTG